MENGSSVWTDGVCPRYSRTGDQDLGDFDSWGSGIEDFVAAPVTDTGSTGSTDATYDGGYVGTFNMTLSHNGGVCTFSNVFAGAHQQWIDFYHLCQPLPQLETWGMANTYFSSLF